MYPDPNPKHSGVGLSGAEQRPKLNPGPHSFVRKTSSYLLPHHLLKPPGLGSGLPKRHQAAAFVIELRKDENRARATSTTQMANLGIYSLPLGTDEANPGIKLRV